VPRARESGRLGRRAILVEPGFNFGAVPDAGGSLDLVYRLGEVILVAEGIALQAGQLLDGWAINGVATALNDGLPLTR
jgi:hypothetical protein